MALGKDAPVQWREEEERPVQYFRAQMWVGVLGVDQLRSCPGEVASFSASVSTSIRCRCWTRPEV